MQAHVTEHEMDTHRYAKCIANSKRMRFDIDRDVIRGRAFDFTKKFLPDGLSQVDRLEFLAEGEQRVLSQIQGRTYANMFGLVERFIAAKVHEISGEHSLGDQTAFEALVRFTDEELKHQEMFRRIELMGAEGMPEGYAFMPRAQRRGIGRARQVDVGRPRADLPHRALRAGALPREHRWRPERVRAVEGRLPPSLERGIAARDPRRDRVAPRARQARIRRWAIRP